MRVMCCDDEYELTEMEHAFLERLKVPEEAFEEGFILHRLSFSYTPGEWVDKLWWDITLLGAGCLEEEKAVVVLQEIINSGTLAGYKGRYRREFARLLGDRKLQIPIGLN